MAALARAQEQLAATCSSSWQQLLYSFSSTSSSFAAVRAAVAAVAQLDALHALATVAGSTGYCRPEFAPSLEEGGEPQHLVLHDGKHPMLDLALDGRAVGNSIKLQWDGIRAAVVTGPNMGGKSVLIRQAALTVIMAQVGEPVSQTTKKTAIQSCVCIRCGLYAARLKLPAAIV